MLSPRLCTLLLFIVPLAQAQVKSDPLGRTTPRGAVFGFVRNAQLGRYATAAQFLQLSDAERSSSGRRLASELQAVLDQAFFQDLNRISNNTEGTLEDGLPDGERVAELNVNDQELDFTLVRVNDRDFGQIWLISAETVRRAAQLHPLLGKRVIEGELPDWLVTNRFFKLPLWRWIAVLALIPIAVGLACVLVRLIWLPRRFFGQPPAAQAIGDWTAARAPLIGMLALLFHYLGTELVGFPLLYRFYYDRVVGTAWAIGLGWLLWRLIGRVMDRAGARAYADGHTGMRSLLLLGRRLLKALVFCGVLVAILAVFGYRATTVLAGLGIGGIAVALAAQKTLENFFGGLSVLSDKAMHVGEVFQIGDRVGEVEDIGLRSTRIRTVERTQLSIPNGLVASMQLENLTLRDKMLFNPVIGLRYETTADQLRNALAGTRRVLADHPKIEQSSARVRLARFGASSLDLEVFSYVLTADYNEFVAIREELLLSLMDAVEAAGTALAFPSQTVYLSRDRKPGT